MRRILYAVLIVSLTSLLSGCKEEQKESIPVNKVTFDVRSLHMNPGKEYQLTVTIEPENASNQRIAWYSSNKKIATVDANGVVRALAFGEVKLTAEANDMHINDAIILTIDDVDNSIPIQSLAFDIHSKSFNFATNPDEDHVQINLTILPENATNKRLKWTSDDPLVATADNTGRVTPHSQGKTTIRATSTDGGNKTDKIDITVIGVKDRNYGNGDDYYKIIYYPVNISVIDDQGVAVQQTWLDRNLGSKNIASGSTDYTAYGSLFQWSRKADGHEKTNWTAAAAGGFVNPLAPMNTPTTNRANAGCANFMPTNTEPHDWARDEASNRDGLWGGRFEDKAYAAPTDAATQANNPCPPGYRVPTVNEFIAMAKAVTGLQTMVYGDTSYKVDDLANKFAASPLKMTWAGQAVVGGAVSGGRGVYWTNMPIIAGAGNIFTNAARFIMLPGNSVYLNNYQRTNAYTVRCIRHTPMDKALAEMR